MKKILVFAFLLLIFSLFGCAENENIKLVRNGKTTYSIIIDPDAPLSVNSAAEELQNYFKKVTGATPEILISSKIPENHFISLGRTSALLAVGIELSDIPNDGFRIFTKESNIFIFGTDTPTGEINSLGGTNNGTSNGVFTFIEDYLGVQWLMPGESGEEYIAVKNITLSVIDRTEFSPFNYRVVSFRSSGPLEEEWDRHLKLGKVANVLHNHSWIETITPSYYDKHPDYFAKSGGKPVIPSGNYYKLETTNPDLVHAFADVIISTFKNNPALKWYSLSPSDGGGFSDSPASKALTEKDPNGNISYTPLVLKFYNDVAKIVGKEFPDHKLGGYIYGQYRYPPAAGLPKLEPNLALMLVGYTHHWRLYRPDHPGINEELMHAWSESAKKDGFDLYFYDYPISLMMPNAMICPAPPDHLNFIFYRLNKYNFKGAYIYGNPVWPVFGAGNYIIAKQFWNPELDAHELLNYYCEKAYGTQAAPYIVNLYAVLDTAYNHFYQKNLRAGSALTSDHLKEIYAANYQKLEENFLLANETKKNERQQNRLEMFGQVLSLLQWHLRDQGLLSPDFNTPLTKTSDEIDMLISAPQNDFHITRRGRMEPEKPFKVEKADALPDAAIQKASLVPVYRNLRMLMHVTTSGQVNINVKQFNGNNEFIRYTLTDDKSNQLFAGVISEGRTISFNGEAGKNYFLDIPSRSASIKLEVNGALTAFKGGNIQIAGRFLEKDLSLYFLVPEDIKHFSITLGTRNAKIDVISPDGRKAGQLIDESRKIISVNNSKPEFWKLIIYKSDSDNVINLTLDENLPPWLIPDPANPVIINPAY